MGHNTFMSVFPYATAKRSHFGTKQFQTNHQFLLFIAFFSQVKELLGFEFCPRQ